MKAAARTTPRAYPPSWIAQTLRLALAVLALAGSLCPATAKTAAPEYAIKAAYLYKFTPFVAWPASAFPTSSSPFYVCVLGADPFGDSLDQVMVGRLVGDHPMKIRRIQALDGPGQCHILYLGSSHAEVLAALSKVRGAPVLTVTEQGGGVVQFIVRDGHVLFSIDAGAAAASGMTVSAKLLSLAAALQAGS